MKILAALLVLAVPADAATPDTNRFGFELYRRLAEKPGNLFLSPYSIVTALAMTSAGARGKTREEMLGTLHLGNDPHPGMGALRDALASDGKGKPVLATANRLWAQTGVPFLPDFLALTEKYYGAGLATLDFHQDPEPPRAVINAWVEEQTRHKIKDLLPSGSLTRATRLVLTNAIYFKGNWDVAFAKEDTKEESFRPAGEPAVQRPFLHRKAHFEYAEDADFQAVRLPYQGFDEAMLLVLPKAGKSLSSLNSDRVAALTRKLQRVEVILSLPKFRVEHEEKLESVLPKMGLKLAFTPGADFSGMRPLDPEERLYISTVVHKAFVEVDEKGTEAAAATAVALEGASFRVGSPDAPKIFRADHPFFFEIEHIPTKTALFLGRIARP